MSDNIEPPAKRAKIDKEYTLNDAISEKEFNEKSDSIKKNTIINLKEFETLYRFQNNALSKLKEAKNKMEILIKKMEDERKMINNIGIIDILQDGMYICLDYDYERDEDEDEDEYIGLLLRFKNAIQFNIDIRECKSIIKKQHKNFNNSLGHLKEFINNN